MVAGYTTQQFDESRWTYSKSSFSYTARGIKICPALVFTLLFLTVYLLRLTSSGLGLP